MRVRVCVWKSKCVCVYVRLCVTEGECVCLCVTLCTVLVSECVCVSVCDTVYMWMSEYVCECVSIKGGERDRGRERDEAIKYGLLHSRFPSYLLQIFFFSSFRFSPLVNFINIFTYKFFVRTSFGSFF